MSTSIVWWPIVFPVALPINFQQLTMLMICGGGNAQLLRPTQTSRQMVSLLFLVFLYFYFALLSLSPFIWLNRSPPELVMMSYRIDKGRIGCQVGFVRGCALTEMLRGALKISYFEKREMIVCVYPLNDKYGYVCRLIYETISRWKLFIRVFG